jgi:glycosyltransferase involved in cell wall biosynthesis
MKISIVTPTLNAAQFIHDCLESVSTQQSDRLEIEHLILDGGSEDDTLQICSKYPVRYVVRSKELDLVGAMCLGYESATGDLIGFLGADDLLAPGALLAVAETFEREQREVIFGAARWVGRDLKSLGELAPLPRWCHAPMHASLGWCYIAACSTFITPGLYRTLGGFRREFTISEDYEFFTRILKMRIAFSRINRPIGMYRRHDDNESMRKDERYWTDLKRVQQLYAPESSWLRAFYGSLFRAWIYSRNTSWAFHQVNRKIRNRSWRN